MFGRTTDQPLQLDRAHSTSDRVSASGNVQNRQYAFQNSAISFKAPAGRGLIEDLQDVRPIFVIPDVISRSLFGIFENSVSFHDVAEFLQIPRFLVIGMIPFH